MEIDFHFGVVYVVARLAGMDAARAEVVAHACQYVDDVTAPALRQSSVLLEPDRRLPGDAGGLGGTMWAPFHFVPGGEGGTREERAICRAGCASAVAAVGQAIEERRADNSLHRLGVSLHAYIDTWAHQGFSGTVSRHNAVIFLERDDDYGLAAESTLARLVRTAGNTATALIVDMVSRLGHGSALHCPDQPWLKWGYRNGHNQRIDRDNLPVFLTAADMACRAVRGYLAGNLRFQHEGGLPQEARAELARLLQNNRARNAHRRLARLAREVSYGRIPGLAEAMPRYSAHGPGSWLQAAEGRGPSRFAEEPHHLRVLRAMHQHRAALLGDILPANRIVLA
jgi:hypothetical protein